MLVAAAVAVGPPALIARPPDADPPGPRPQPARPTATTDTIVVRALSSDSPSSHPAMPYEPGSPECRVLIDCKTQIESMLLALSRIERSDGIVEQLRSVHSQLEELHAQHRRGAA